MSSSTFISTCALLFIYSSRFVLTQYSLFDNEDQLFEGNRCQLANGAGEGVCTKAVNCPVKMREIVTGNYSRRDRCGFSNFDEIVCCANGTPEKIVDHIGKRRAEIACDRYKKIVSELEIEGSFHTVVFNGVQAKAKEFPHMAALGYVASDDEEGAIRGRKYICGGTLVTEKHVITAAHCVSNIQGLVPVEVLLGTIDLDIPNEKTMQRILISRITKHPEHRHSLNYHDVAILELKNSVKISDSVQPTCLTTKPPESFDSRVGRGLDILGWGAIDLEGTQSNRLLKAQGLRFVEKGNCSMSYKYNLAHIPNGLDDGMICVGDPDVTRKADTCWGDSGGPLLVSSTSFPQLAGVTSFGQACGGNTPGVYSSIYKYLNWIEGQIWPA